MTNEQLTLIAAAVAAATSLLGVVLNARSSSRIELGKWRRQDERQLAAGIVKNCREAGRQWSAVAMHADREREGTLQPLERQDIERARRSVNTLEDAVRTATAELELIAGTKVVDCADRILDNFESVRHLLRATSGADDRMSAFPGLMHELDSKLTAFIDAVRKELRVDRAPGFRRRMRAARQRVAWTISARWYRLRHWRRLHAQRKAAGTPPRD
ncbi:hypothetical protein AB0F52_11900 [Amycolatopsis sp. NPDC024027]|uniref:hypothetical protein n=1 Tax=Amycolatopsis sp. NPDC024027 TaxID=3154327 RepID=UPI0033C5D53E